jgi:hypothetical protein
MQCKQRGEGVQQGNQKENACKATRKEKASNKATRRQCMQGNLKKRRKGKGRQQGLKHINNMSITFSTIG